MSSSSKFVNSFKVMPKELFRVNNGRLIKLREWTVNCEGSFDLRTEAGKVKPKALSPTSYSGKPYLYHIRVEVCNRLQSQPRMVPRCVQIRTFSNDWCQASKEPKSSSMLLLQVSDEQIRPSHMQCMLRHIGTPLPDDLILVHEHTDHYSLQPAKEMSLPGNNSHSPHYVNVLISILSDLNGKITTFLETNSTILKKEQWLQMYPKVTEPSNGIDEGT